jgi:acyl-CoA thioester hydrolase
MIVGDRQKNRAGTLDHANLAPGADAILDGWFDAGNHLYPLRVQYEDTDAGGIVYHAQYLVFAERARSAWLRCLGIDQPAMLADGGLGFVVRRIEVDFHLPASLGDILDVESGLLRLGGASLKLQQKIINRENRHILARLIVDIGLVELAGGARPKICRLPAAVKAKFSNLALPDG